jgi:hypothetical protein
VLVAEEFVGYEVASGVQHALNVLVLLTLTVSVISNGIIKWNSLLIFNSIQHEER